MKTLIIANFPKEEDLSWFKEKFVDELKRDDVIFIENPKNKIDLEKSLKSCQGEFDRVVVSAHGSKEEIPVMKIAGEDFLAITDVIKAVNKGNEKTLKKIHLTSCHIGSNFEEIEQKNVSSKYYLELEQSLRENQILFLHGDAYTGDIVSSLDQRLKGIVENKDYSVSEAVFDSVEVMSVATKKRTENLRGNTSLDAFSYQPFFRVREDEEFTTTSLIPYLSDVVEKARGFEEDQGILNKDASMQRLKNLDKKYFQRYFTESFTREIDKAIDDHNLKMVEFLIKRIDPNIAKQEDGWTPLIRAVSRNQTEIVKLILENNETDCDIANEEGFTALMIAAEKGYAEIVELLLAKEANPNIANNDGWTPLMFAAKKGYAEIAKLLIEKEANPNIANEKDGWTPLILAVSRNQTEVVKLILENEETDINLANKDGFTALIIAAEKGNSEIVELLLAKEADPNIANTYGYTALIRAAVEGHSGVVKLLLEKGVDPNIVNEKDGWTPLILAVSRNQTEVVKLILENEETDINLANKAGFTSLIVAAEKGHAEIVKLLIEKEANPNIAENNGVTALMSAAERGRAGVVKLLIEKGVDPNIANQKDGWTPLMFAANKGQAEIVKLLIEKEVNPNIANNNGWTPLMFAVRRDDSEMVKYLIEKGADPEMKNLWGNAASSFAEGKNKDKIIELLSQAIGKNNFLKEWQAAFSKQEIEEMRNETKDYINQNNLEGGLVVNSTTEGSDEKVIDFELQKKDSDPVLEVIGKDFSTGNPGLIGGEVVSPDKIEEGVKILLGVAAGVAGLAVAKVVATKFGKKPNSREKDQ